DFTDKPLGYVDFGELVRQRTEFVLPLTPDELELAISGPARRVGLVLEHGLVNRITHDVGDQPGGLPLLQYALTELFERRQGRRLTLAAYNESGGVLGALGLRAEEIYSKLDEPGREAARQTFLRLVTLGEGVEDTRRRVLRSEVLGMHVERSSEKSFDAVLDNFGHHRLFTFDHDPVTRGPTVEVAHEALLREWPRLRAWLDESRADVRMQRVLGNAAAEWLGAEGDPSFLLRGSRLDQFEGWAEDTELALTTDERDFLDASLEERRARQAAEAERQAHEAALEQRSRRFLRALVGVFAIAAVVAVILSAVAFNQRGIAQQNAATATIAQGEALLLADSRATQQAIAEGEAAARATQQAIAEEEAQARATAQAVAEEERAIALDQRQITLARELAFASANNLDADPERSVLLALEAIKTKRIIESTNALHQALPELSVLNTIDIGAGEVDDLDFTTDGTKLAMAIWSYSSDVKQVEIWDVTANQKIAELSLVGDVGKDVAFSPDENLIAASGWTGKADLTLWNANTGEVLHSWVSQPGTARSFEGASGEVAFSPDASRLAVANLNGTPHVLDVSNGEVIFSLEGHTSVAEGLAYSPDGSRIATGDNHPGGEVIVWDANTGKPLLVLEGEEIYSMAFSPDGSKLAAVGDTKILHVWNAITGEIVISPESETAGYRAVAFSHDGKYIYTGGQDSTIRIWDASTGKNLRTLAGHRGVVISLALSPDGRFLASGGGDGYVKYWDLNPGKELFVAQMEFGGAGITLTPNGSTLVVAGRNNIIDRYDPRTGEKLEKFMELKLEEGEYLLRLAFTPDRKYLVAGLSSGDMIVFDYESKEQVMTLRGHEAIVMGMDITSDGRYMVTSGFDNKAIVWDLIGGNLVTEYTEHSSWVLDVVFSQDDQQVISASNDGTLRVWDPVSGETLRTVAAVGPLGAIEITPDGHYVVSATVDGYVSIWDADTWEEIHVFQAHTSGSWDSALSADGSRLVTAGFEGSAKVWEIPSGEPIATLYGHELNVTDVEISPDGEIVYTSCWDGLMRAFILDVDELIELAESRVTRSLTEEECQTFLHLDQCPEE
ncbi:MAG: hypothetical protein PVG32_19835, partial [Anaerolineales bacterium]